MRWRTRLLAGAAAVATLFAVPAMTADADAIKVPKGTTIVSFNFDDGWKGQEDAGRILGNVGWKGTFYINSGQIGYPNYMKLATLTELSKAGHEIGGHTVDHENLDEIGETKATEQICDDRATLVHLGFRITSFAYPYGSGDRSTRSIVQKCGYSSARATSGLRSATSPGCDSCPYAEDLPPGPDYWKIRTGDQDVMDPQSIEKQITTVQQNGGGWLPLVFHHVCDCPEKGKERITPKDFQTVVSWIARRPGIRVYSMDQVIGGENRPIVGQVIDRWDNVNPANQMPVPGTNRAPRDAFHIGWVGIGQGFVISLGLVLAISGVLTWRFHTRGNRYHRPTTGGSSAGSH